MTATNSFRISGARIVDGSGQAPYEGSVVIDDGRFTAVDATAATAPSSIDVRGMTLLPGLIDAHTHLGLVGNMDHPPANWALVAAQIWENCGLAIDAGFTTVRDDGGVAGVVASGAMRGSRILPSGPIISEAGGNGDLYSPWSCCSGRWAQGLPGLTTVGAACRGPEDVRETVRLTLRRGATQVKVSLNTLLAQEATGADTEFSLAEVRVAVEEAHAKGTYVTGHAINSDGIRLGLAAGVECFEHSGISDDETAKAVAAAGAPLVPTLTQISLFEADPGTPAHLRVHNRVVREEMERSLLRAEAYGIPVGLGSDLEGVRQVHRGSELTRRAALQGTMHALVSATAVNAAILRRPDLGRIAVGATADAIVIDGDPLADPGLFDRPESVVLVIKSGVVMKNLL